MAPIGDPRVRESGGLPDVSGGPLGESGGWLGESGGWPGSGPRWAQNVARMREGTPMAARWPGRAGGFTLMEMLLVVLIIGLLAAMIVPRLIPQAEHAKVQIAQAEVTANLPAALDLFMLNVGRYPTTEEGLDALWSRPPNVPQNKWQGPYLKRKEALDPWGNSIAYHCPPRRGGLDYDLISFGPDGIEHTDDDITNADEIE